mmetsp:Transcript_104381/g.156330  ORF Transcript_104381/g.156330 Transcript_104381/m.156330 type:complete len:193 (+) Transcript_104381:11-589(+)
MSRKPFVNKPIAGGTVAVAKKVQAPKVFIPKSSKKPFGNVSTTVTKPVTQTGKRSLASLFGDEDEDEEIKIEHPPKKPLIQLLDEGEFDEFVNVKQPMSTEPPKTTEDDTDPVDPLDIFMTGIAKEPIATTTNKGIRDDIESEDNFESFVKHREDELRNHPELNYIDDEYNSGDDDYLDSIRADHTKQKKIY